MSAGIKAVIEAVMEAGRVIFEKRTKNDVRKQECAIIDRWHEKWYADPHQTDQLCGVAGKDCFAEWLEADIKFLRNGCDRNRCKNFMMKLFAIIAFPGSFVILNRWNAGNTAKELTNMAASLALPYLICQWVSVKKYQETWGRYAGYYAGIMQEMTKYIYDLPPYDTCPQKERLCFMERILMLTDDNGKVFYKNMTEKEKEIFNFSALADKINPSGGNT